MEQMETESEALERLRSQGFTAEYHLSETGRIEREGSSWKPEDLTIETALRFEGMSNPDDEAMILAIAAPDGMQGTLVMPYGPDMTTDQVDATQSLLISHRDRNLRLNAPDPDSDSEQREPNPRMQEVHGDEGMPGEYVDTPNNEPGDQSPPAG